MSSVSSSHALPSRRQYIASMYFNTNIFQYTTSIDANLATVGTLTIHPSATTSNCTPQNILRENGKKLHTGTHTGLVDPTTQVPYTYLVGVYDVKSGINGFINPNAPQFAVLTTDKSYQDDAASYQIDASKNTPTSNWNYHNTSNQILGPSVMTAGDVVTNGRVVSSQLRGTDLVYSPGYIVAGPESMILNPVNNLTGLSNPSNYGQGTMWAFSNITTLANINASNGTLSASNVNGSNVRVTTGRLFLNATNSGNESMAGGTVTGPFKRKAVSSPAYFAGTSRIFLTYSGQNNPGILSGEPIADGSFNIVSNNTSDNSTVYWMVIN